jgi:hypothetical protein
MAGVLPPSWLPQIKLEKSSIRRTFSAGNAKQWWLIPHSRRGENGNGRSWNLGPYMQVWVQPLVLAAMFELETHYVFSSRSC